MKSLIMGVCMAYRRPTASLMAHMEGMVMGDMLVGLGTRLRPRARAPGLDYAPREPSRRYASMAQLESIGASVCAYGTGIRMSVHPLAHPTLPSGRTLPHSPSCGPQPTPSLNNRYSRAPPTWTRRHRGVELEAGARSASMHPHAKRDPD